MKNTEDILYIVMPAYNEGENIQKTVESWIKILDDKSKSSRLVIADSGSTDNTHDVLLKLKKKHQNLEILEQTDKQHGPKVIALYQYAIKNGADYIFQTDSDGQTNPVEFDAFWQERQNYDAIFGHRNKRGDGKARAAVEKVVCLLLRLFFDVKVPDANAPFRLMKAEAVAKYLPRLPKNYNIPNVMLTAYFARFDEKIAFRTISFKPRTAGINSINIKKIFCIGKEALADFFRFRKDMQKADPALAKRIRYHKFVTFLILSLFAVMTLLIVTTSPSHPWNRGEPVTDSGVFLTVGTQMKNGLIPYRDTFDHKGPLLFIINYLGVSINQTSGILVFECIALFFTAIALYKIARLKCSSRCLSVILVCISMSLYISLNRIDRGNLTEEYAMPLIAISLYYFLKYFTEHHISLVKVFISGFCFGCVVLLRANMVIMWGVFCLVTLIQLLRSQSYKQLWRFVVAFTLGMFTIVVPIFIWLITNHAFGDFIDTYIIFNAEYSSTEGGIANILKAAIYFLSENLVLVSIFLASVFIPYIGKKKILIIYLIGFIASLFVAAMSGRMFPHYAMILVPFVILPLAILCENLYKANRGKYVSIAFVSVLVFFSYAPWRDVLFSAVESFRHRQSGEPVAEELTKACEITEALTAQEDAISVYGNRDAYYLRCRRLPATKYSYQLQLGQVRPQITEEYFSELQEKLPKIIIQDSIDERMSTFAKENGYKIEWQSTSEKGTTIYSRLVTSQ